jgi:hypothetical protein
MPLSGNNVTLQDWRAILLPPREVLSSSKMMSHNFFQHVVIILVSNGHSSYKASRPEMTNRLLPTAKVKDDEGAYHREQMVEEPL